jgi:hypothetical protein
MSISHWGIFPGICWWRYETPAPRWRELDFDFWCLTQE